MMILGRPRVSTDGQSVDAQAKTPGAIKGAGFRSLGDAWADIATPRGRLMLPDWSALIAPAFGFIY
jgi:hypothetical protein